MKFSERRGSGPRNGWPDGLIKEAAVWETAFSSRAVILSLALSFAASGAAHGKITGKYYDPKYTPNVAEFCKNNADSIISFGKQSIELSENACKIKKVERWPNDPNTFDFFVNCADGGKNKLMVQEEKSGDIWVQWQRGPASETSGVIYKKCPSVEGDEHIGSALNIGTPENFPNGKYYFDLSPSDDPKRECGKALSESNKLILFGQRKADYSNGSCQMEEIRTVKDDGSTHLFEFNGFCGGKDSKPKDIRGQRYRFLVRGTDVFSKAEGSDGKATRAVYHKCLP